MKYVFLGTINPDWVGRQKERLESARKKAQALGVTLEGVYYTQGIYDFVDIVEASDVEGVIAFSLWYARQGYGRITTMPAFGEPVIESALEAAAKS